jgi:hypothetical protein
VVAQLFRTPGVSRSEAEEIFRITDDLNYFKRLAAINQ